MRQLHCHVKGKMFNAGVATSSAGRACSQHCSFAKTLRTFRHANVRSNKLSGSTRCAAAPGGVELRGCRLVGIGSSVPQQVISNEDLEKLVETNDAWITTRTGIKRRHVLGEGETLYEHAAIACQKALAMAGVAAEDIDLVLMATSSPDDMFGSACQVQAAIGANKALAFDLTAACSGFVLGVITGSQFIKTGTFKRVLVIGADALSRFVDWRDRGTCILFGDGCGAVVMTDTDAESCSLLGMKANSDGNGHKSLNCQYNGFDGVKPLANGNASTSASYANLHMSGQDVFKFAVRSVPQVISQALDQAGMKSDDVEWLLLHQANQRIIDATADRLGFAKDRVISNVQEYGNTSAASIPIALDEAVRDGRVKPGQKLAVAGFGAGLTWAAMIVRWG